MNPTRRVGSDIELVSLPPLGGGRRTGRERKRVGRVVCKGEGEEGVVLLGLNVSGED